MVRLKVEEIPVVRADQSPPHLAYDSGTVKRNTLSIPSYFHRLWLITVGPRGRCSSSDARALRSAQARVFVTAGHPPSVTVVQVGARDWTVRVVAPADWVTRLGPRALVTYRGKPSILLEERDGLQWVLVRPRVLVNAWAVVVRSSDPEPSLYASWRLAD